MSYVNTTIQNNKKFNEKIDREQRHHTHYCDGIDGYSIKSLFENNKTSITYNDFILFPNLINFTIDDITLQTRLTKRISLNIPCISSPMDTVTESKMAIAMALAGGIGIIHNNLDAIKQAEEVRIVKSHSLSFPNEYPHGKY